jgi:DNA-binding response OmpR family regulator
MRVLLIEDEGRLAENIVAALRETGFAVDYALDGQSGSEIFRIQNTGSSSI